MNGSLPPHAPEAEAGVLGSLLLAAAETGESFETAMGLAQEKLSTREGEEKQASPFFSRPNAIIWDQMLQLDSENKKPDLVVLLGRLRDSGQLDEVGGAAYLDDLMDASPSSANISYYLDIVVEKFQLRRALRIAGGMLARSNEVVDVPNELARFESDVIALGDQVERDGAVAIAKVIPEVMEAVEKSIEHRTQGLATGLQTPWGYFNKLTMGLRPPQVTLIGGGPSSGKTSLMLNIAHHIAVTQGAPVGILSAESGRQELTLRLLCIDGRVNGKHVHSGYASESDVKLLVHSAGRLTRAPIVIDARDEYTPRNIRIRGRRLVKQFGCQILMLDHIHECYAPEARGDMKLEGKMLMASVRWLARVLYVPVVVLAQLNREGQREMDKSKRRKPMKSDLRESGYLEQMSDNIGILYRDRRAEDGDEDEDKETVEAREAREETWQMGLEMVKQRNGPTGGVQLTFHRPTFRFVDRHANTGAVRAGQRKAEQIAEEELMAEAEEDLP